MPILLGDIARDLIQAADAANYSVPIRLSRVPDEAWVEDLKAAWSSPASTSLYNPIPIAVDGDLLTFGRTTVAAYEQTLRSPLLAAVKVANEAMAAREATKAAVEQAAKDDVGGKHRRRPQADAGKGGADTTATED